MTWLISIESDAMEALSVAQFFLIGALEMLKVSQFILF